MVRTFVYTPVFGYSFKFRDLLNLLETNKNLLDLSFRRFLLRRVYRKTEQSKFLELESKMSKILVAEDVSPDEIRDAASTGHPNIIEAQGITKMFGKTRVLEDINLNVPQGSVLALLGPNGAGKTTTVRILTTLLKPDGGSMTIAGYDVVREPDKVRSVIGVAGQSVSVDGDLSGLQNLTMIGRLYRFSGKDAKRRAQDLIEQFDLTEGAHRPVVTYSGGMRRRLDLAASLVAAPPILFLDEPTTGLDPESRNTAWEVIRCLVRSGTTLLLTTQYLEEADQLADMVTVIDHGRILTSDTPTNLKNKLGGERLDIKLTDPADITRTPMLRMKALPTEIQNRTLSFSLPEGESGLREVAAILLQLITAGVAVKEYAVRRPTLEEAFLQLVGSKPPSRNPVVAERNEHYAI
jgi:ABC-2 type transport system ATP-binding protein